MLADEIAREQEYVSMLYGRLDDLLVQVSERLTRTLRQPAETGREFVERDAATDRYADWLARLEAAENGLCFGRLDFRDGERHYIGRIGISAESEDGDPLLLDWRAPAARPYYLATAVSHEGVRRRRHIRTQGRRVVEINDDVLGPDAAGQDGVVGEAALLAALNAGRTGRMGDIVATIQAEQDKIIRHGHRGVLVVQGGPGTGKTVVALHRAAYLLYTHRDLLARRGVLVVGPSSTFLRYIGRVLPSLGETDVLLASVGELYPGVRADRRERPEAAAIKGGAAMADVLAAAVADRQWVPDDALEIEYGHTTLRLDRDTCARVRERARRADLPHNAARPIVARAILDALARQAVDLIGADVLGGPNLLDEEDVDDIRRELDESTDVHAALDRLWPVLTPQRLLADLYASPERLTAVGLEPALFLRGPWEEWTTADVPLLDEAAELLGEDDSAPDDPGPDLAYAQGVLDVAVGSRTTDAEDANYDDAEKLTAADLLDAEALARRHEERDRRTTAERAAADRTWAFGHVIVDEAQELSQMAWRMLMRRCPTRWMTIVGDVAQTSDPAGAPPVDGAQSSPPPDGTAPGTQFSPPPDGTAPGAQFSPPPDGAAPGTPPSPPPDGAAPGTPPWRSVLAPYVGDRWRMERLTVNYRMPAEIMEVAASVVADPEPPRSVRRTGHRPWRLRVSPGELPGRLHGIAAAEAAAVGDGKVAVIVPAAMRPDAEPDLRDAVVMLDSRQAKGLEFDSVIVAEPAQIMAESPRGNSDLYVALSRATQRLGIVHTGELPAPLAGLLAERV